MKHGDYIGIAGAMLFGLWWILFPQSVIKFYRWFYSDFGSRKVVLPSDGWRVRLAGAIWIALVLMVAYFEFR
jgi:hypothetical protein